MNLKLSSSSNRFALTTALIGITCASIALAAAEAPAKVADLKTIFAQVGNAEITKNQFDGAFASTSRSRFYHGKPPEAEVAALQREVGDKLITDLLLVAEANRQKMTPDADYVKQNLEKYDQQNAKNEQWKKIRDRALPILTTRYENESLLSKLELSTRKVPAATDQQLQTYYKAHPDKFTEPEQLRVSVILLKVDPGAPSSWDEVRKTGKDIVKQLRDGADFAEMAKKYSGDEETVNQGGDMGYQHGGMMSEMSEQVLSKLKPGEISDTVGLMEGIAIFKLTDRKEAKLNSFEAVKQRASELYTNEEGDRAWQSLIAKLKKDTPIKINESLYLPLTKPAPTTK
ncbi:MAG: peptidylprolyl isomerase [Gallionella sp.]